MKSRLTTLPPVRIGEWTAQASIYDNDSICVIVYLKNNLRCFVRFFDDENKARIFVQSIINQDHKLFQSDK